MLTSGRYFDFEDPGACEFLITDVAHSLSNLCRFTGHCSEFYSVAQHSLLLSHMVDRRHALSALMSNLPVAFVGDASKPLKALLPDYAKIESRVRRAVFARMKLSSEVHPAIQKAQAALLEIERQEIQLPCGRDFDLMSPATSKFDIYDIANALSNICRYTGYCHEFYSVAQHCVLVSYAVPPEHALKGLMHDSAEAFIGDVSKPLKILLPDYAVIEDRIEGAVFSRFGLSTPFPPCIKQADIVLLRTEQRDVMRADAHVWALANGAAPLPDRIAPLAPAAAREAFIRRFEELGGTAPARPVNAASIGKSRGLAPMDPKQAEEAFMQRFDELAYA